MKIAVAHSSGQYSDPEKHQVADAHQLISQMRKRGWQWLTGTEAGGQSVLAPAFRQLADSQGVRFHKRGGDVWILYPDHLFSDRPEVQWVKVEDGEAGQYASRGILRVTGDCSMLGGDLTILVAHYVTKHGILEARTEINCRIAETIAELGRTYGRGPHLCFYGGDQNINDQKYDTFLGAPFTSLADEVGKHPGSGHGPIDVIASYNGDKRVKGLDWEVLPDDDLHLFSDHYVVEGTFEVARWPQ